MANTHRKNSQGKWGHDLCVAMKAVVHLGLHHLQHHFNGGLQFARHASGHRTGNQKQYAEHDQAEGCRGHQCVDVQRPKAVTDDMIGQVVMDIFASTIWGSAFSHGCFPAFALVLCLSAAPRSNTVAPQCKSRIRQER